MPFYDDGTSLPPEAQLSPDEVAAAIKRRKEAQQAQQAQSPQQQGGSQSAGKPAAKPQPAAPKPEKMGPAAPGEAGGAGTLQGIGKFMEEKIGIPVADFIDNTFQGNQKTPDQIAQERLRQRVEGPLGVRPAQMAQRELDKDPAFYATGEIVRGVVGGAEDLVEGAVNLPFQISNFAAGTEFKPVNFGLVRENSSTAGRGLRTISRYVMSGLGVGAATRGGLGAGATGLTLFGARAAQGFAEDFIAADGSAEDNTLIGSTPFTQWLQTSDENDPLHNRALVGLEGALFEAAGIPAVKAMWQVSGAGQAARKLGQLSDSYFKGKNQKKMFELMDSVSKQLGVELTPIAPRSTQEEIEQLLEQTRNMLADPKVLRDQKKLRAVAEYHQALREAAAPRLALAAQQRLKKRLFNTFAQNGEEIDYTKVTERDLAIRLIQEDPQRLKLNALIAEAAGTADETDAVFGYLRQRVEAFQAAKELDDIAETVQYGGKPDELVIDAAQMPRVNESLADLDDQISQIGGNLSAADEALGTSDNLFRQNAQAGGQINKQIAILQAQMADMPTQAQAEAASSIKLSLSKAQVDRINQLQLPEGVTITPGRRVQGLTADNIDDFRAAVAEAAASGDKVAQNLSARLDNMEVPAKQNIQTQESIQQQLEALRQQRTDLFGQMVPQRQQYYQARAQRNALQAQQEALRVQREAIAAKATGNQEQFAADYIPVDTSTKNVTSIVKESSGGQPGIDLYFEDKRFPAVLDGQVLEIGRQGTQQAGYGNYIVVRSVDPKTGQNVDVLYAHLEDGSINVKEGDLVGVGQQIGKQGGTGSVRSVDGTIASIDFLAPAPKGSKSMVPYAYWNELADDITLNIKRGGLEPSQVGRKAPSVTPEAVADAARQADEIAPTVTRKQAIDEGYEVDSVTPVRPRTNVVDDFLEGTGRVEGTVTPAPVAMTDMDYSSLGGGRGTKASEILEGIKEQIERSPKWTEAYALGKFGEAREIAADFLSAGDDQIKGLWASKPELGGTVDGDYIFSTLGLEVNGLVIRETVRQIQEVSGTLVRHMEDGAPQASAEGVRLMDRLMFFSTMRSNSMEASSGVLRHHDTVGRHLDAFDVGGTGRTEGYYKHLQDHLQDVAAKENNHYQAYMKLRERLVAGDPKAYRELERFANVMNVVHPTAENFNAVRTAFSMLAKDADNIYVGSLLSGPKTQNRNFWGGVYQTVGYPLLALLKTSLPGSHNRALRHQAVAALAASFDGRREFVDLMGRLIKKNWDNASDAKEFTHMDEALINNIKLAQDMIEKGELDPISAGIFGTAINIHKIVASPIMFIQKGVGAIMGGTDGFIKILAARQVAAMRAVEFALDQMGEAPLTGKRAAMFGELVEDFKQAELKKILSSDGLEIMDQEAKELGEVFTFQTPLDTNNVVTRRLVKLSEVPGAKLAGLTFVKTPANILKGALQLSPGISTLMKQFDQSYKKATPFQRAVRDGAEAMSYLIMGAGLLGGASGTLTGAGPLRGRERDTWLMNNKPFTLTIGDFEFNYQGLEPAASVLGTFADLGAIGAQDTAEHGFLPSIAAMIAAYPAATSSNLVNKSYLTQLSAISQLVNIQDENVIKKVLDNWARGLTPLSGLRQQMGQAFDNGIRELRSEIENSWSYAVKKHGGMGLSAAAPQRLDPVTGQPLTRDGMDNGLAHGVAYTVGMLTPFQMSKNRFKAVHQNLEEEGFFVEEKTKQLMGTQLTNEEMVEYTRLRADNGNFAKALNDYFNSDQYKKRDKPNSAMQRREGMDPTKTDAYRAIQSYYRQYHNLAVGMMEAGLTEASIPYSQRLNADKLKRAGITVQANKFSEQTQQTPQQIIQNFNY